MVGVLATFRCGRVELSKRVDWPDGTPLEVVPLRSEIDSSAVTDHRQRVAHEIAEFAASHADSELDLDPDLEAASLETLDEDEMMRRGEVWWARLLRHRQTRD